jgi:hypothetical protein
VDRSGGKAQRPPRSATAKAGCARGAGAYRHHAGNRSAEPTSQPDRARHQRNGCPLHLFHTNDEPCPAPLPGAMGLQGNGRSQPSRRELSPGLHGQHLARKASAPLGSTRACGPPPPSMRRRRPAEPGCPDAVVDPEAPLGEWPRRARFNETTSWTPSQRTWSAAGQRRAARPGPVRRDSGSNGCPRPGLARSWRDPLLPFDHETTPG